MEMELLMDAKKLMLEKAGAQEEAVRFLSEQDIPLLYEWAFLCAMDGMPAEDLKRICKEADKRRAQASELFMAEREAFLEKTYENNRELNVLYKDLLRRVEIMYEKTSALEEGLSGKLTDAIQAKDRAFGQMLETKDKVIRDGEKQIAELKGEISVLKRENKSLLEKNDKMKDEIYSLKDKLKTAEINLSSVDRKETQDDSGKNTESPAGQDNARAGSGSSGKTAGEIEVIPYARMAYGSGRRRKWRGLFKKEDTTADEFIRLYIENSDYSHEQQDYLIKCLEQGDSLDIIKEFASPSLSVANMDWLRRIIYRRMR